MRRSQAVCRGCVVSGAVARDSSRRAGCALLLLALLAGCGEEGAPPAVTAPLPNVPPQTSISTSAPRMGNDGVRVLLAWSGSDQDGEVAGFQWQIEKDGAATPWVSTTASDSAFLIDSAFQNDWHFRVRAVDDDGDVDPDPAAHLVPGPLGGHLEPFRQRARNARCTDQRHRLALIDRHVVFWGRTGSCFDNGFNYTLFTTSADSVMCFLFEFFGGVRSGCNDPSYWPEFATILDNLDAPDLGLIPSRRVEEIPF